MFYTPSCKKCVETVEPLLKQLARRAENEGWQKHGLAIGKMDVSKNECKENVASSDVDEVPKLVMYPAVEKSMENRNAFAGKLTGKGALESITAFALLHARTLKGVKAEL